MSDHMHGGTAILSKRELAPFVSTFISNERFTVITVINVKKLQFIHMLTATDLRASKTAKIKKLYYYISLHIVVYVNVQQYSKITFLFLLFSMCEGLSPLTCV